MNYPWLLAVIGLIALFIHRNLDHQVAQPGAPDFVGPPDRPSVPANFLLRASVAETEIGNAFAARLGGSPDRILLSALHRFGPAGGLPQTPSASQLAAHGDDLRLRQVGRAEALGGIRLEALPIGAAATIGNSAEVLDLAGFAISGSGAGALAPAELEPALPAVGHLVWLVVPGPAADAAPRAIGTQVFAVDPAAGLIYFRLPPDSLTLAQANAETGAPIVGPGGEVLGIHIGAALDAPSAPPYGLALGTAKFLPYLLQAIQGPPAPVPDPTAMASAQPPAAE